MSHISSHARTLDSLVTPAALDDENETLKDSDTYEAFGVVQSPTSTNGPSVNPFRFVGQWGYYDDGAMGSSASLSLLVLRFLNRNDARFISRESLTGPAYVYALNDPTGFIDAQGTLPQRVDRGGIPSKTDPPYGRPPPAIGPPPGIDKCAELDSCITGCGAVASGCIALCRIAFPTWRCLLLPKPCAACYIACGVVFVGCLAYCYLAYPCKRDKPKRTKRLH